MTKFGYKTREEQRAQNIRREIEGGNQIAYDPGGADSCQAVQGRNGYLFAKDPIEIGDLTPYILDTDVPVITSGAGYGGMGVPQKPAIDTLGIRGAVFYLELTPSDLAAGEYALAVLIEAGIESRQAGNDAGYEWFPLSVVDPTIRGLDPVGIGTTSLLPTTVGYRNVHQSQLNFPIATNVVALSPLRWIVPVDATPYPAIRLRYALTQPDTTSVVVPPAGSTLRAQYTLFR